MIIPLLHTYSSLILYVGVIVELFALTVYTSNAGNSKYELVFQLYNHVCVIKKNELGSLSK